MTRILDQIIGITGRLIENLLDWPFLLFAFLVWLVIRYRDQIGSMLDRRGAVKAGTIHKAVRVELEPIRAEFESVRAAFGELRYKVEGLLALELDQRVTGALDGLDAQFTRLEVASQDLMQELDRVVRTHVPELLTRERESEQARTGALRADVEQLVSRVDGLQRDVAAYREALSGELSGLRSALSKTESELKGTASSIESSFAAQVKALSAEAASLNASMDRISRELEQAASCEAVAGLEAVITPLSDELSTLRAALVAAESDVRSTTAALETSFATQVEALTTEAESLKQSVERISRELEQAASCEALANLESTVTPLSGELAHLRSTLATVESEVRTTASTLESSFSSQVRTLAGEAEAAKIALERISCEVGQAASCDALSSLESTVTPISDEVSNLRAALAAVESELRTTASAMESSFTTQIRNVSIEAESLKSALERVSRDITDAASRETVDRVEHSLVPLAAEVSAIRESLGGLDDRLQGMTNELHEQVARQVEAVRRDLEALKAMPTDSIVTAAPGAPRKSPRRGKDARK